MHKLFIYKEVHELKPEKTQTTLHTNETKQGKLRMEQTQTNYKYEQRHGILGEN